MTDQPMRPASTAKWISGDRLRAIIDAYGASAERWPEDERDAALALIARSETARAARAAAAGLDHGLDSLEPPAPGEALAERLRAMRVPLRPSPEVRRWRVPFGGALAWPGPALVAAGVGGLALLGMLWILATAAPDSPGAAVGALQAEVVDEPPSLLSGIAIVDPLPPEDEDVARGLVEPDLDADGPWGFGGGGGVLLAGGGLALE